MGFSAARAEKAEREANDGSSHEEDIRRNGFIAS